jgi:hypothetical protein
MSWKDAKSEATAWLDNLGLAQDLKGQEIDLAALTKELPQKGRFREMVVRATARQLKARGAKIKQ